MDLLSKDILKQALQRYDGTLIIVSHDRDFLDGLVNKIYEFKDGRVKEHLGGVNDFLERKRLENLTDLERRTPAAAAAAAAARTSASAPGATAAAAAGASAEQRKELERQKNRRAKRLAQCEEQIAQKEQRLKELEDELCNITDLPRIQSLTTEYEKLKFELDSLMNEWEKLAE